MFTNLFDYSSYEPVETVIDSAFTSMYRDSLIQKNIIEFIVANELNDKELEKAIDALEYANIYSGGYNSSKFNKYYNEAKEASNKAAIYLDQMKMADSTLKSLTASFKKEYIGWEVKHRFRSKNKGGNYTLGNYIFIVDPDFKEIIYGEDADDEGINKIKTLIDNSYGKN